MTYLSGEVDTIVSALVGNEGSSSGTITDDPPPANGTSGLLTVTASAIAGPVGPGSLPTLPGTQRQLTAAGLSEVDFTQPNGLSTLLRLDFVEEATGAGGYAVNGISDLSVEFTVDEPTDYSLTGTYDVFPEDLIWSLRLIGPGGALVNAGTENGTTGTFDRSGTLQAGVTYILRSSISGNFATGELGGQRHSVLSGSLSFQTGSDPEPPPTAPFLSPTQLVVLALALLLTANAQLWRRHRHAA